MIPSVVLEPPLGDQMEKLVNEYGITAVTHALITEVESRENWRQTDNLKGLFSEYVQGRDVIR